MTEEELPPGMRYDPVTLTPEEFEAEVEKLLIDLGTGKLTGFNTQRRETIQGTDGDYEIDVTARFEALGANFLVLVECKHHKHPIKRDIVQVLRDRLQAVGAQKGVIFATTSFQSGAVKYASQHGIALIQIADGKTSYFTKGTGQTIYPSWLPPYVGYVITLNDEGNEFHSLIGKDNPHGLFGHA